MKMYLGLDISTSCTGWCVLDDKLQVCDVGFIDTSKVKAVFKKAQTVLEKLEDIHSRFVISDVYIEENLQAFRPGLSSAKTLLTLARFNGIISYICEQTFKYEPIFVNVNVARKTVGLKIVRQSKGGKPTKEQVFDWVNNELKGIDYHWPRKILKSGPRKGESVLEKGCYDAADAYVVVKAGLLL
jgi:Holliday junction resolvasome RuvABC endonuclease subunit